MARGIKVGSLSGPPPRKAWRWAWYAGAPIPSPAPRHPAARKCERCSHGRVLEMRRALQRSKKLRRTPWSARCKATPGSDREGPSRGRARAPPQSHLTCDPPSHPHLRESALGDRRVRARPKAHTRVGPHTEPNCGLPSHPHLRESALEDSMARVCCAPGAENTDMHMQKDETTNPNMHWLKNEFYERNMHHAEK